MTGEIQSQMQEYDCLKLDLQHRIKDVEEELNRQRQEMTAAFDSELRQQEHEFNLKIDELCAVALSHDIKVKLLLKEAEFHYQAQLEATEALRVSRDSCQQIHAQLQQKDQEIKDIIIIKDHRIKELEDELKQVKTILKDDKEVHIKKYQDLVQALKKRDAQLEAQHQADTEQLHNVEKRIVKLQENMEVLMAQSCCKQQEQLVAMDQRDKLIQRLYTETEAKNSEVLTLQDIETKHRTEIARSREQSERYKLQLSAGLKRERTLKQIGVQVELEWQRRCEDMKAEHYLANEQLIQDLTHARDQAKAELKEKEQELQDLADLLHSVKAERDQALPGLPTKVGSPASEEIHCLQEQNILHGVITQMRKNMDSFSHNLFHPQANVQTYSPQQAQHPGSSAAMIMPCSANTQEATETSAQSSDVFSKVSHADGSCLGKQGITSALPVPTSAPYEESAHFNIRTEQSALVQQLQEESLYLQQQTGGLFKSVHHPPLCSRLKQAVSRIARLSREKQQLIEMGNRLRAQITTVETQEKQGNQHDQPSAPEQLQYQLTTQELQYAVNQGTCTVAKQLIPGTNNHSPFTKQRANTYQDHKTIGMSQSSKNSPPLNQLQSQLGTGLSRSQFSSLESLQSLQELWAILDYGLMSSEGEGEANRKETESSGSGIQMAVNSSGVIHNQPSTNVQQKRNPSKTSSNPTKTSRPGAFGSVSKIRNYNVKD